jgi:hypothetical protein
MYTATESKELKFHFLDKRDLAPIGYDKVNKETGESVAADDIVRGFEVDRSTRSTPSTSGRPTTCCRRTAPRSRTASSSGPSMRPGGSRSRRS